MRAGIVSGITVIIATVDIHCMDSRVFIVCDVLFFRCVMCSCMQKVGTSSTILAVKTKG